MPTGQLEAKTQKQSQVQEQTGRLDDNLTELHGKIGKLQDRLSSVLRSSVPLEQGKGQDRAELVSLACTIEDFGNSAREANNKIEDLLERIKL